MTRRTRQWLRRLVKLGARAGVDGVTIGEVERQEDTVLRALDLLERQPGVILADEVGMGKTFEALGVIAALRHATPGTRVLVITPGPDLNAKWKHEFDRFSDPDHLMHDFGGDVETTTNLTEFASAARRGRIVLVPVSAFTSTRRGRDKAYLLSLFVYWLRAIGEPVNANTAAAIMRRFAAGRLERVDPTRTHFLGEFGFREVESKLGGIFSAHGEEERAAGLYELYQQHGLAVFEDADKIQSALDLARFRLLRKLLPPFDLIVIDEAHKLKNAGTVRYQAVSTLLRGRFDRALFLTATPFQLDVAELKQVFRLFALARSAPADLMDRADRLLDDIRSYQEAYNEFESVWRRADGETAEQFRQLYEDDPTASGCATNPNVDKIARCLQRVRQLKEEAIQPEFRRWMIRSIRRDRRTYRRHERKAIPPTGEQALPFLVGERLIAEMFRTGDPTHKPAAQISLVSSYGAARKSALVTRNGGAVASTADQYRGLLRGVLNQVRHHEAHPKIKEVLSDALEWAERGDKTLVFCTRLESLSEIAAFAHREWLEGMVGRWKMVFPRAARDEIFDDEKAGRRVKGRHTLLQARFNRTQDPLYLALRERYLSSALGLSDWAAERAPIIAQRAQTILETVRVSSTSATRFDYRLAKRCIEHAAATLSQEQTPGELPESGRRALEALLDPRYVKMGFRLRSSPEESLGEGAHRPRWRIAPADVRMLVGGDRSLWVRLAPEMERVESADRAELVEQVARFLTFREVPFLIELLADAKGHRLKVDPASSKPLLQHVDVFWDSAAGAAWLQRLRDFVSYFASRDPSERRDILHGPIRTGEIVRQTKDGETREKLREAFNTPLYPMILVANEVMQEGLDLHRFCARVVHHDLAWNPAQLEQRVGRVDRIGSLTAKRLQDDPGATLHILYPLLDRTVDVRMYRSVKKREKWIEFLLGAAPTVRGELEEDADVPELPPGVAESLAIDLGPPRIT